MARRKVAPSPLDWFNEWSQAVWDGATQAARRLIRALLDLPWRVYRLATNARFVWRVVAVCALATAAYRLGMWRAAQVRVHV